MARPLKRTVDYFPHQCEHGKTLFILEQKYGNDGYAFWFKLLEILGKSEGHFYEYRNPADIEYLNAKTHVNGDTAIAILNLLSDLDAIDGTLWENKIIWSDNFVNGIKDVYSRRNITVPLKPLLEDIIVVQKPNSNHVSDTENPQIKIKENRLDNSKITIPEEYKKLSAEFHTFKNQKCPDLLKERELTDKLILRGAEELHKLNRLDGYTFEEVQRALQFAAEDKFWSASLVLLSSIRNRGKNGNRKFVNILASMSQSKTPETVFRKNQQAVEEFTNG